MIKFKTIIARFAHAKNLINSPLFLLLEEEGRKFFLKKYIGNGIRTGDFSLAHMAFAGYLKFILEGDPCMFAKDDPRHDTAAALVKLSKRASAVNISESSFTTSICLKGISYTETYIAELECQTREITKVIRM